MNVLGDLAAHNSRIARVVGTINDLDEQALDHLNGWTPLADLSSATRFDGIEADPDSIVFEGDIFQAIASIYVMLVYEPGKDELTMSDEYVATIKGHESNDGVIIDEIEVDTSSFYE